MSRPESPIKSNACDDEIIKKLKALLIKEKRLNKENGKTINEMKAEHEKKSIENNLLIGQIQRLSETIGNLGESEYIKVQEIDDLKNISNSLRDENDRLICKEKNSKSEFKEFFSKIESVISEKCDFLLNKKELCVNITLPRLSDLIIGIIDDCSAAICVQKELQILLRSGLEAMTVKCNKLETVIESNDERISSINDNDIRMKHVLCELGQREEQIQRLEELIEDNRNISRALETERDQLQNDLMDLRQRHEEKEGYLIDEYREAQQSLENYRIFTDKQSAEKANEIERLRKCLDEPFLSDCLLCRDLDSSFDKLRAEFDLVDVTISQENVVLAIIERYRSVCHDFENQINRICENESQCLQNVDDIRVRIGTIEQSLEDAQESFENAECSTESIENLRKHIVEMEGTIALLRNERSTNQELREELRACKCQNDEKDGSIADLSAKLDSIVLLSAEKDAIHSQKDQWASRSQEDTSELIDNLNKKLIEKDEAFLALQKEMEQIRLLCTEVIELFDLDDSSPLSEIVKSTILIAKQLKSKLQDRTCQKKEETLKHEQTIHANDMRISELVEKLDSNEFSVKKSEQLQSQKDESTSHSDEDSPELVEDLNRKILEKEERLNSLREEIDEIKSLNKELRDDLEACKVQECQLKDKHELTILEKNERFTELEQKFILMECLLVEKEKLLAHIDQSALRSDEDNTELVEDLYRKILEKEESLNSMRNEMDKIKSLNKELRDDLEACKVQQCQQKDKYEHIIHQKNEHITELEQKFISIECLLVEKEKLQSQINQTALQSDEDNTELVEDLYRKILEKEESLNSMRNEMDEIKSLNREIEELFDLDDSSSLLEMVKSSISTNRELRDEIHRCKIEVNKQKDKYEHTIQIKDGHIAELEGKLTEAGKQVNDNDLMNLEMAEIDKTLVSLNNQLKIKSARVAELELTMGAKSQMIETVTEQIHNAQKQNQLLDERNNKMKQMLVKTKRELADIRSQASVSQEKEMLHSNEVERLNVQIEDTKVLLSEAINEREKMQERYSSFSKKMDSVTKSRDMTISSLRSQLELNLQSYNGLQQEFDLYKVKVQTAFNTKLKSPPMFSDFMSIPANDKSNTEDVSIKSLKKEISDLEMTIDDLKMDLREKDDKIVALNSDLDQLRWENEKLSDKHRCVTKETNELSLKMQQINEQLQTDTKLYQLSHSESLQKFNAEKERLSLMYQEQIESIRSNYEIEIENLSQRIEEKEMEKIKFQEEIWDCREQLKAADNKLGQVKFQGNEQSRSVNSDMWTKQFKTPMEQERQQGEGMEMNNEADNGMGTSHHKISPKLFAKATNYNSSFVSLDQLLNSHNDEGEKFKEEVINSLKSESNSFRRQNEHLAELLNDNEATVARLTEQAMLLKAEIRRLENNEERDHTLEDHSSREYLKNVIVKFLHYDTKSDERSQLVPVITTLLSLDSSEKELLTKFSSVNRKRDADGWSSYFGWAGAS